MYRVDLRATSASNDRRLSIAQEASVNSTGRVSFAALLVVTTCVAVGAALAQAPATPNATAASPPGFALAAAGPKKRIAVLKFDVGAANAQAVGADLGSGLAAQLTTALVNSGQYIVVERAELASVLREQELGLQKLVPGEVAAQAGQLVGAQLLVRASVTDFEQRSGGGGLHLGIGVGPGMGALGAATNTGVVGIDVRVIDTTTGQVLQSHHVESKIESQAVSADVGVRNVSFGGDAFEKTPLGQATRQAIEQAVAFVLAAGRPVAWTGRVVEANGDQVFVNAGADAGLRPGDRFMVSAVARQLTDPASGAVLGVIEAPLGDVVVVNVQPGYSIAQMVAPFQTKRGDLVKPMAR
jgi:curli biogenesis system outer membrane secretion channel CsgG